jgi:tRNA threonylcarbamoyladenosine biosynthesis protein TsaE
MRRLAVALTFLIAVAAWPAAGRAHPHVWITAQARLGFEQGAITAVAMRWGFDPMFSDYVRGEYDKDGNGSFDAAETGLIAAEAFANLKEFDFLTHLSAGGEELKLEAYRDFAARMEGDAVVYEFVLPLPRPVDPRAAPVKLALYDDTFYLDITFSEENPVSFAGDDAPACGYDIRADAGTTVYMGLVNPLAATLTCPTS